MNSLLPAPAPSEPPQPAGRLTPPWRKLYLLALSRGDTVTKACRAAGVNYRAVLWTRSRGQLDPAEEAAAYAEGTSALEQEALRRGRESYSS